MTLDFPVIGIVAILVGLIVQVLAKPILELWIKPQAPNHDTIIRAVALLLGVLLTFVDVLVGHAPPGDGNGWLLLIGSGAVSGLASIGGYHALSGSPQTPPATGSVIALPALAVTSGNVNVKPVQPDATPPLDAPKAS